MEPVGEHVDPRLFIGEMDMTRRVPRLFSLLLLGILSAPGYSQTSPSVASLDVPPEVLAYPEMILFNGKILTVDEEFSTAEALAIRDGRILALGDDAQILKMAGPQTQRFDLEGKTAVPGLIDTHYHLNEYPERHMLLTEKGIQWEGKVELLSVHWKDAAEALRDIQRAVDAASPGEWVRIPSRNADVVKDVTLEQLDTIAPNHPVVIAAAIQLRPAAVNSKALQWAEIPPDTPGFPSPGGIMITGRAAILLAQHVTRTMPAEKAIFWHKQTMGLVNSWGLTMVVTRVTPDHFNSLREIWLEDQLTVRWRVAFPGPLDIPNTGNMSDIGDDWLRISGAGGGFVPGSRAAFGHWSTQVPVTAEEVSGWPQGRRQFVEALRYGWSIPNSHILGNIAVRAVLDAMEEALQNPIVRSSNQRLTMDHMVELFDEDFARIRKLNVIASITMRDLFSDEHARGSSSYQAVFGADYVNTMVPLKAYLDMGIRTTVEADMGDEMLGRPLWTIGKAVCRCVDGSARIWNEDQKVSRQDALRMKTTWAAAYVGDQKILGSLEAGKLADLVVVDGDYMSVPEDQISELEVILTLVGGKVVFSRN